MTQTDQQSVPKLRFPGFSEPLASVKLGEIASFSKGKGISKNDITPDGALPCIRYGELYTVYNTIIDDPISRTNVPASALTLSKGDEVLVPASGEDAKDIATAVVVKKPGIALGGDLNIIRSKNDGAFLASYLSGRKRMTLAAMAQGNSVVHLYPAQLKTLDIHLPTLPEQRKIASFLSALDTKIVQLSGKKSLLEDYKKGCMQQLFSQGIRFKDENGKDFPDWQEKKLGELADIKRGASPRPISSSKWFNENSDIGWVRISDVTKAGRVLMETTQKLSEEGVKKSRFVPPGRMIMSICATIGKPVYTGFPVCIHDGFVVFENLQMFDQFLFYYLEQIEKRWYRYGQPGTQVNLNSDIVANEIIYLPHPDEQRKIADFLSALDRKIELVGKELEHANTFKKGLLQQMFV